MHRKHTRPNRRARRNRRPVSLVPLPRQGTVNNPPDNSGTVQIPKPLSIRTPVVRRTFKATYTLSSQASASVYSYFPIYSPFYVALTAVAPTLQNVPASFTDMFAAYACYKVKRVQLIFESLLPSMSAVLPVSYTVGMVVDIPNLASGSFTSATLDDYQNSTKVSPLYPSELTYRIPSIASAQGAAVEVLQGGWIATEDLGNATTSGSIVVAQPSTGYTASTPYSSLTITYEVWFKSAA